MSEQKQQPETSQVEEEIPKVAENVELETDKLLDYVLKGLELKFDDEALKLMREQGGKEFKNIFAQLVAEQQKKKSKKKTKK
ncbi:unnamed protein product [Bursaphelenchus okinawaensis]|uniref:Uncharacterized protein n=1 Tax=Bursaphelenchus okinawaensis TaxID=465554 RepID=A0A811K707_9BILA|nr:unnamed protein product [Bursaphelenchus okinawaensis]CAG9092820.1 unnamed protein product [Bursaphelenchus okinawaensis]